MRQEVERERHLIVSLARMQVDISLRRGSFGIGKPPSFDALELCRDSLDLNLR